MGGKWVRKVRKVRKVRIVRTVRNGVMGEKMGGNGCVWEQMVVV